MDTISHYRLRKLASMSDLDKGAVVGSATTAGGLLGGLGTEYALFKNKRFNDMIDRRIKMAILMRMRGNKLKALGHAALAGLAIGAPVGVSTGLGATAGAGISAKLAGVKPRR